MTVDSGLFATLVAHYHDRDVALFQVSGDVLAAMRDGAWSGPLCMRLDREEGAMMTITLHDLSPLFEEGWNGRVIAGWHCENPDCQGHPTYSGDAT